MAETLRQELALGPPLDLIMTALKMVRSADMISSRASAETAWKPGRPKKEREQDNGAPVSV
jgi:hypothetical protein